MGVWKIEKYLSTLSEGVELLTVCDGNNNCQYVCKSDTRDEIADEENFFETIKLHNKATKHGLAPKIYQVNYDFDEDENAFTSYIIMELLGKTLKSEITQILKDTTKTDKQKFKKIIKLFALAVPLGPKLNKIGITIRNLDVSNIVWNPRLKKWQAIDFGVSRRIREDDDVGDIFYISNFPLLKKFLKNYLKMQNLEDIEKFLTQELEKRGVETMDFYFERG
jgi:serine/threonine protein kinase